MTDWSTTKTRHGTHSGWRFHGKLGEEPCGPCWQARHQYDMRRKAAPEYVRKNRQHARAQQRAYVQLKSMYPDEYRVLYQQAKVVVAAEDAAS